jgi:hypothetical protein
MQKIFTFLGVGVLVLFLVVGASWAQETRERSAIELQIGPTKNKLTFFPGESVTGKFKVRNNGANEFDYTVYVRPYQVVDEEYTADFETEVVRTQMSRWVILEKESGHLAVGETDEISYTIKVPEDVPDGGQYAVIFVETGLDGGSESTGIATRQRLGYLIYGRVAGTTREEGKLVSQGLKWWWWRTPIQATSLVENTGNVDFDVSYNLTVKNILGRLRDSVDKQYVVLPDTKRLVTMESNKLAPLGVYQVTQTVGALGQEEKIEKIVYVASPLILAIIGGLLALEIIYLVIRRAWRGRKKRRE